MRMLIVSGVVAVMTSLTSTAATPAPAVDSAAIDAVVDEYRRAIGLPGTAVVITHGNTEVHAAGYGRTPTGEHVTEHTPMAVASVSKSFTALAVMQLVETGRVNLDQSVQVYLPEFAMADPRATEITVRQLLDQTSGMSDTTFPAFSRPQPSSLVEAVAGMRGARLAADPGTQWEYHNPNFQVAARMVEVTSGQPFDEYLQEHVFGPLGMTDSRTVDTARDLPPSAHGHLRILGVAVPLPEPPAFGNGSGGVLSSAHDMAAWLIAQNNQGRGPDGTSIASAATVAAMHTPSTVSDSYALGWSIGTTASGAPLIAHSGDLFTSTAYQALLPASGYGLAVMANTGLAYADAAAIAERLIALLENTPTPPTGPPLAMVDSVLLLLVLAAVLLGGFGVHRSGRWAAAGTGRLRAAPRLLPLVVPLVLFATIHRAVGLLYRGRDVTWIQVTYLYPTFMLLLATATLACIAVLVARLIALAR
ncbi:serine hydrolase domain-containing protein [Pseudonocardia alaniniphila]|uniref:Beta-lactamase family protein n=1 Tax=Pseudonocardia alaniniphila TaxID=75291 RepID=A0ABS9TKS6_9PSEU|nr:beta-lactamase family protein [Pseudonocardia alaniniphila]MCH6169145.1 beta-lactamase family protein [Pseudonocardia alaniniphila]